MLPSNKTIWNIAYPIMIGNLAQTLIALTDTAFLGRISEVALGASSMAAIYYYVFSTLAWGFAVGVQVIIARRFGEANYKRIGVIFEHGLYVVSLLGVFLFVLLKFLSADILRLLISSDNVYHVAMQFINYRSLGIFFVCINFLFRSLYIGVSNTKIITYTTLVMAVVNILFNYLLIFGHWGFPNLGVQGAAIASVFAEVAATIFFVVYTLKMFDNKKFTTFKHHKIEPLLFKRIFSVAIPTMMQKLISFGTWLIFFSFLERMGERALASSMTVRSAYMMIAFPVFAFGATSNTLVSRIIGEGNAKGVEATIWRIFKLCCLTLIPLSLFAAFFPNLLLGIYTDSSELIVNTRHTKHCYRLIIRHIQSK
ncbi:MAG: MATE family efflux transporter [Rikenellaceae bacterium]